MTSSTHLHINNRPTSIVIPPLEITSRRYGWISPETFNELAWKKSGKQRKKKRRWNEERVGARCVFVIPVTMRSRKKRVCSGLSAVLSPLLNGPWIPIMPQKLFSGAKSKQKTSTFSDRLSKFRATIAKKSGLPTWQTLYTFQYAWLGSWG